MLIELLKEHYGLHLLPEETPAYLPKTSTYPVQCEEGCVLLHFPTRSERIPAAELPKLCTMLRGTGIPADEFLPNTDGEWLTRDPNGRLCHVRFAPKGQPCTWSAASETQLLAQAEMLGKIHAAMADWPGLQERFPAQMFLVVRPEYIRRNFDMSMQRAIWRDEAELAEELAWRTALMDRLLPPDFDFNALTCQPVHGDYQAPNIRCDAGQICAVTGWQEAAVAPVVWEITRSYVSAAPECASARFDDDCFARYVRAYERFAQLNDADRACLKSFYFYQQALTNDYARYENTEHPHREPRLKWARLTTAILKSYYE